MSEYRKLVIEKLLEIQNTKRFQNEDILTITGFMKDHELRPYLQLQRGELAKYNEKNSQ